MTLVYHVASNLQGNRVLASGDATPLRWLNRSQAKLGTWDPNAVGVDTIGEATTGEDIVGVDAVSVHCENSD
jgi:hypothetical protein